jgi:ABC-2 type transport system permease protein
MKHHLASKSALRWFGFNQTRKGAFVMGLFVTVMILLQGFAYAASYPTAASRSSFAATLKSVPALGIIYGENADLSTPAGYVVYRSVAFLSLITAIWGLSVATRLLRGQEEDGRWELISSGNVNGRQASWNVFLGYVGSLLFASGTTWILVSLAGLAPDISLTFSEGILITLAIYLPAFLFASLGYVVSQLAVTRRRAMLYGLVPLIVLFSLRSIGNTISDLYWLKNFTPFGWVDRLSPIVSPQVGWLLALVGATITCILLGIYLVAKRDMGAGLFKESDRASSHFFLLRSGIALAFRQSAFTFIGWAAIAALLSLLMAAIANVAARALSDSPSLRDVFAKLGGTENNLKIAFIGTGFVLTIMILLLAATSGMAAIRNSEAKGYLDNILIQPIGRNRWLLGRLVVLILGVTFIALASGISTWLAMHAQNISTDFTNLLLVSIALTGTTIFALGVGTLLYGIAPRAAVVGMYVILVWSFIIDALGSVIKLADILARSSLFHYVSSSPVKSPDWMTFAYLAGLGLIMMVAGSIFFTKRDITSE